MIKKRVLVSVSGGRSSALMAKLLWDRFRDQFDMQFVFANTSREKEETLLFVHNLTVHFGIPITWVEAIVHHGKRKGSTHKIVTYETATRDGSVFEEVIKKYGIPNVEFLHCTRELKTNPIRDWARTFLKWGDHKKYTTVIGYRADEPGRVNLVKAHEEKQWYPLYEWRINKQDVAVFWKKQVFDLGLEDADGNCKKCYKKTDRKIMTQIISDPQDIWIDIMEEKYENFTPPTRTQSKPPYRFFRHGQTLQDLRDKIDESFISAIDKSMDTEGAKYDYDAELDEIEYMGCGESCEPF